MMRAATALVPKLQATGSATLPPLWRGNDWLAAETQPDCVPTGFPALDCELPGRGWPQGQLVELLGEHPGLGELSLLLPALAAVTRAGHSCVWVLPCTGRAGEAEAQASALPYAPALQESGIDLGRCIFVRPLSARESGWALEQSLRTAHLGAVVGWLPQASAGSDAEFRFLRRLHLLAQRHRALVFILRSAHRAQAPSPAPLRLQVQHNGHTGSGQLQLRLLKRRGRPLLEPVALQVHPAHWNRALVPGLHTLPTPAGPIPDTATPTQSLPELLAGAGWWVRGRAREAARSRS